MSENKCCGNCKHFNGESFLGNGWCNTQEVEIHCSTENQDCYEVEDGGWIEITQDNEERVYDAPPERLVIANIVNGVVFYSYYYDISMSIATMAKMGGYYYYVLPELKINNEQADTNQII